MRNIIFMAIGLLMLAGCTNSTPPPIITTVVCQAQTDVVNVSAQAIATALTCSNLPAIQASLTTLVAGDNVCPKVAEAKKTPGNLKGTIGNALCPGVVAGIVSKIGSLPDAAWGCTGAAVSASITTLLLPLCESAITI